MHVDYDSDGGDKVTYRHFEEAWEVGKESTNSNDFHSSLWSKKRGKFSNRSEGNNESSNATIDILQFPHESDSLVKNIIAGEIEHETVASQVRDEYEYEGIKKRQRVVVPRQEIDVPNRWKDAHSRLPQRPKSRLVHAPASYPTNSLLSSEAGTRNQQTSFLTAALPLSSRHHSNSSRTLGPTKPSWLPQVSVVSRPVTNRVSIANEPMEDIVDESFNKTFGQSPREFVDHSPTYEVNGNLEPVSENSRSRRQVNSSSQLEKNNTYPLIQLNSPIKSKHRGTKIGSLRWKFDKIVRDATNLETYLSSADIASTMHDPRGRVSCTIKCSVVSVFGIVSPYLAIKVLINTFEVPIIVKEQLKISQINVKDAMGVYQALVLLKPNMIQEKKLQVGSPSWVTLYDPVVVNSEDIVQSSVLCLLLQDSENDASCDKIFVCSIWEAI